MTSLDSTMTTLALPNAVIPPARPASRPGLPAIGLLGPDADATVRRGLEERIAATFSQCYGATIEHFLPYLISLSATDELGAVAGLRLARQSRLFLEQYLDAPIEQAVSREFRTPVDRAQIMEIGNLASAMRGSAALLFAVLPAILNAAGMRWVVCTATPQVQAILGKLQFPSRTICAANPVLLGDAGESWGSYYSDQPKVIVGNVQLAVGHAAKNRSTLALTRALARPIDHAAAVLRAAS